MSHCQIHTPKHYFEQVIQALEKYLQLWPRSQHKPILMSLNEHQAPSKGSFWTPGLRTKDSESPKVSYVCYFLSSLLFP